MTDQTSETVSTPPTPRAPRPKTAVRHAVEFLYDLQKLRIATESRGSDGARTAQLDDIDKAFFEKSSLGFDELEKSALKYVSQRLKGMPIYEKWLVDQKGCGPTMSGVIVASFDIQRADTPSKFWAYAGLTPNSKRVKGQKTNFDPWLKAKMVKVLADCFIKSNSPWRKFYDDYKNRKKNTMVDVCMACEGSGRFSDPDEKPKKQVKLSEGEAQVCDMIRTGFVTLDAMKTRNIALGASHDYVPLTDIPSIISSLAKKRAIRKNKDGHFTIVLDSGTCANCEGTGGPAPWGKSDAHRDAASRRYMIKMFLLELWKVWRGLEGLPIRPSYAEEYLGRKHHVDPGPTQMDPNVADF